MAAQEATMSKRAAPSTAIQKSPAPVTVGAIQKSPAPAVARPVLTKPRSGLALVAYKGLMALASLRLTVVLFALSLLLVLFGTLAQMDLGLYAVLHGYFRAAFVWVPWQLFVRFGQVFLGVDPKTHVGGTFPFPGGWLLGSLLLVNVLAAHAVRFRISWKRSGVLILHTGLIVLMLGELVTGLFAVEARMTIAQGESISFTEVSNATELAITDTSSSDADQVTAIPASLLKPGQVVRSELLPFDVEVVDYLKNSDLADVYPGDPRTEDVFTALDGKRYAVVPEGEAKGVDANGRDDVPAVRVRLLKKDSDQVLGTYLLSVWFNPNSVNRVILFPDQQLSMDGKAYKLELRPRREYKPYSILLREFHHEVYPGTDKPKDYTSLVHLTDPSQREERDVRIYMNNPLRYGGETFYQTGFLPGDRGTVLQVVRNPGWLMPYFSCILVALGMAVHFGLHLAGFLQRRFAQ
jgi:hypothetical protein